MMPLSIEHAMHAARGFAQREWRLLLPVALAFQALPSMLIDVARPAGLTFAGLTSGTAAIPPWFVLLSAAVMLVTIYGALSLAALLVIPRQTVREALLLAGRRLPAWAGAAVIVLGGWLLLFVIAGVVLTMVSAGVPGFRSDFLLAGLLLAGLVVMAARLMPLVALLVDRPVGPVVAVKAAWAMTRGHFWRLLGFILLFGLGTYIVNLALLSAIGSILLLVGKTLGAGGLAAGLVSLLAALLGGAANTAFVLIAAAIYRQLSGASRAI